MFATDISLKYGTHQPETILETMPIEEASEIIKEKLRDEVRQELECEYGDRLYEAEEEASNWEMKWSTKTGHRVRVFPVSVF